MDHTETYNRAIKEFGLDPQIDMCIEEMSELTKALIKHRRDPKELNRCKIAEEIADVQHTLDQMKLIFSSNDEQDIWMNLKIVKLERKLMM